MAFAFACSNRNLSFTSGSASAGGSIAGFVVAGAADLLLEIFDGTGVLGGGIVPDDSADFSLRFGDKVLTTGAGVFLACGGGVPVGLRGAILRGVGEGGGSADAGVGFGRRPKSHWKNDRRFIAPGSSG